MCGRNALGCASESAFQTASNGSLVPAWRQILFVAPCIRKLDISYEIHESADSSGLRYVVDDMVEVRSSGTLADVSCPVSTERCV